MACATSPGPQSGPGRPGCCAHQQAGLSVPPPSPRPPTPHQAPFIAALPPLPPRPGCPPASCPPLPGGRAFLAQGPHALLPAWHPEACSPLVCCAVPVESWGCSLHGHYALGPGDVGFTAPLYSYVVPCLWAGMWELQAGP